MSSCINRDIGKLLDRYQLDLLSDQEAEQFERHILECDFCAAELEKFSEESTHLLLSATIQAETANLLKNREIQDSNKDGKIFSETYTPWWKRRIIWATAAILIILLFKPWKIEIAPDDVVVAGENRIAIMPITSDDANEQWLGNAATSLLVTNLSESDQLTILTTQHVSDIIEYLDMEKIIDFDADLALRVADKADANWVIIGKVNQSDPELAMNIILLNTLTGDTVTNEYLTGIIADDLFSIIDKMTDSLKTNILKGKASAKGSGYSVADITTRSPEAYRHYLRGVTLFEQLYYADAESSFVKAISYDSTFAMAYYYLASLSDSSYIDNALKYINKCSRREQYYIRASAFLFRKDTDSFFKEMEKLTKDFPFDAKAYSWSAGIERTQKKKKKALDYYYQAIKIDPYQKLTYNSMTYLFLNMGDFEKALWANNMYIAISPDEANPYDTRGDIYAKMGDFDMAIESYLKVLEIKPFFSYTYSKLCEMYQLTRNFDKARYWYQLGWTNEHGDEPFPANITASMLAAEGKFEKAIETIDNALPLIRNGDMSSIDEKSILIAKAFILKEKDPLLAFRELEKASKLDDSLSDFRQIDLNFLRCDLLNKLGYYEKVDSCLEDFKRTIDTTTMSQYNYSFIAGYIDLKRNNYGNAILNLRTAFEAIGTNHDFESRYWLAIAYTESGRFEEAVSEFRGQLKNQNYRRTQFPIWNAKIHYYLGRAYEGLEKYQLAVEQYKHFVKIWSNPEWDIKEINDAKSRLKYLNKAS